MGTVEELERQGWAVVEGVLDGAAVDAVRGALAPLLEATPFGANSFVGRRTKRVFGLPAKTRALDPVLTHDVVLAAVDGLLGPHLLSTAVAVEIHPGEEAQTPHTDGSAWPVPPEGGEVVVNAIWALDDFTEANGATLLPTGPVLMPSGSVLLYVGSLVHGGGPNTTDRPRLALIAGYTVAWVRQQENFTLLCPPDVARRMPPALTRLLGYSLYPPFVGHVDGGDPNTLL